jgi:prophage tail gpP-like protein/phage tail protein X
MSNVTALNDDTFERISRQVYGSQAGALQIAQANPGVAEPIPGGTVLVIPPQLGAPTDSPPLVPSGERDEVVLNLSGERFRYWNKLSINLSIDRAPTIEIDAVWEPENVELRRIFRPLSFHATDVNVGGERLFTGVLLTPQPDATPGRSIITANAYGRTGTLSDCTMPASAYSLEFNDQGLKTIAETLLQPFGIGVQFDAPLGAPFEQKAIATSDKILPFLADLAQQRNMVIGETADGKAWFRQSTPIGKPVAILREGAPPAHVITAAFEAQAVYSHVTGIAPSFAGLTGPQLTVKNPHVSGVLRPYVFEADDSQGPSLQELVDAKAARMFGNMVSWDVTLPTWRDPQGDRWAANTTLIAVAPRAMIYKETELLIRSVTFHATPESRTAELNLVLPGAFSGQIPESLPWDE